MYKLKLSKQANKDMEIAEREGCKDRISEMMGIIEQNPFEPTPGHRFEKLMGYPADTYSRRITGFHRFIYEVLPNTEKLRNEENGEIYQGFVKVVSMWAHNYK
jgi:Txe/YoeB family toxin of toxin-antitoxin system